MTGQPVGLGVAALAGGLVLRRRYLRWGATDEEVQAGLPGDEELGAADLVATRAITVHAAPLAVWPWLAQMGQGRGGLYSYDRLENLVGCDIHSAERVMTQWQHIEVGDDVRLAPTLALRVTRVDPGRVLVLRGGVPIGDMAAPYDFTWAFVICKGPADTTRLVVRERYRYANRWVTLLVEPVELISTLMSQKMLRGIRDRAEGRRGPLRAAAPGPGSPDRAPSSSNVGV